MARSSTPSLAHYRDRTAPLGVKLICVLGVLASIYTFIISLRIMAGGGPFMVLGLLLILLIVAYLYIIYGLWTVKPWAWMWAMILFGLGAVLDVFRFDIVGLVISLIILAYLYGQQDLYEH